MTTDYKPFRFNVSGRHNQTPPAQSPVCNVVPDGGFDEFTDDASIDVQDGDVVLVTNAGFRVRVIDDPGTLVNQLETAIAAASKRSLGGV